MERRYSFTLQLDVPPKSSLQLDGPAFGVWRNGACCCCRYECSVYELAMNGLQLSSFILSAGLAREQESSKVRLRSGHGMAGVAQKANEG